MFLLDNSIIRGRNYPQYSRKNVDNRRGLWEPQQIAVGFDVITGETRGKCTKVLDRAYLSIRFSRGLYFPARQSYPYKKRHCVCKCILDY